MTPTHPADAAMQRLLEGNQRYRSGQAVHPRANAERRSEIAHSQKPFAMILGCVDSRVPPELIFDCGLGDLFVIRSAGQALDRAVLGSLEFGVAELHIPLLVVLGHEKCGAVIATIEAIEHNAQAQGNIQALVEAIRPAVEQAHAQGSPLLESAVQANILLGIAALKRSGVLGEATRKGELKIVGAHYSLASGLVEIVA